MTLLVVDPDDASASILTNTLSQLGFTVSRVAALDTLPVSIARRRPDLVLCPFQLDRERPLELAAAIVAMDPTLPVAVFGREFQARAVVDALRLGIVDVIELSETDGLAQIVERAVARGARIAGTSTSLEDARTRAQLREFQRDQRAGRYIQMGMLPPSPMAIDRYRLRHKLFPSLMLSGDFVDYFRITERHFAFYIADVSGHGASSAFVTVLLKNFSRRLRREYRPKMLKEPGEILAALNRELLDNRLDKHVAIFIGVIDLSDDSVAYANGGHFPSAMLCDDGGCRYLELAGKPVGLFEGATWISSRESLRGPATLAMVSDGVLEIMGSVSLAEKERRLLDAVHDSRAQASELWQVLGLDQRDSGPDDIACLVISKEA